MYRILSIDCAPFICGGTSILLSLATAATIPQSETVQAHYSKTNNTVWQTFFGSKRFEPPGDHSPNRTSGLGSRSHYRQIDEVRLA